MLGLTLADVPSVIGAVLTLVLLEGLLSADNALVLAVMVRHLPKEQQKRALRYGIWGAFVFRFLAVIFAYQLIQFWFLKVLGGAYLIYLAAKHFLGGGDGDGEGAARSRFGNGFWATVVNVELADIAFSIDSILAAVGMVESLPQKLQDNQTLSLGIIYIGGVLGIIMMRLVAGLFLVLLEKYKGLAAGAYFMVAWIGLKLFTSGIHDAFHPRGETPPWVEQVPHWVRHLPWEFDHRIFWAVMGLIAFGSIAYRPRGGGHAGHGPTGESALADADHAQTPQA